MLIPRQFLLVPLLAAAVCLASATGAAAQQVQSTVQVIAVTEAGNLADVEFRVAVTNGESSALSNVNVVFEDGIPVSLGDVAAGGSAVSAPERRVFDRSALPTRNFPVPVKVQFVLNGVSVEVATTLVFGLSSPVEGGR